LTGQSNEFEARVVAVDIEEAYKGKRGAKLINLLLASKGKLYRTARGRMAVQLRPDIFEKLKPQIKATFEEGYDGTVALKFEP
jgi:hypothetical protein